MAETQPPNLWIRFPLNHVSDSQEHTNSTAEDEAVAAYSITAACAASVLKELKMTRFCGKNECQFHVADGANADSRAVDPSRRFGSDATESAAGCEYHLCSPPEEPKPPCDSPDSGSRLDSWQQWRFLQQVVGVSASLGVALELTADLPSEFVLQRWLAEPLRCILIPTSIFIQDESECRAVRLSDRHLGFLLRCVELNVRIVLVDTKDEGENVPVFTVANETEFPALAASAGTRQRGRKVKGPDKMRCTYSAMLPYFDYLQRAFRRLPPLPASLLFSKNYRNVLQMPMQPLADDLSACSYEVRV